MSLREFQLENLNTLDDGRVVIAWNHAVVSVAADCDNRCMDSRPRKVTLVLELKPVVHGKDLDSVSAEFSVKQSVPPSQSKPYSLDLRKVRGGDHQLVFNDLSLGNVHQGTIDQTGEQNND